MARGHSPPLPDILLELVPLPASHPASALDSQQDCFAAARANHARLLPAISLHQTHSSPAPSLLQTSAFAPVSGAPPSAARHLSRPASRQSPSRPAPTASLPARPPPASAHNPPQPHPRLGWQREQVGRHCSARCSIRLSRAHQKRARITFTLARLGIHSSFFTISFSYSFFECVSCFLPFPPSSSSSSSHPLSSPLIFSPHTPPLSRSSFLTGHCSLHGVVANGENSSASTSSACITAGSCLAISNQLQRLIILLPGEPTIDAATIK